MVDFNKYILDNGLKLMVHRDESTPIATVNLLYNVGSKHENPERTGFAHLFEHLMFEGSVNIPSYDTPLQKAGGENNAFTTNDLTNYYLTLPLENIETAFWLESDRMLGLKLTEEKVEVQKNVVIEEFNQRYLNQPYGDAFFLLRPMAYKVHPYQWSTIGKDPSHIKNATLEEVKDFFYHHYAPNNAILSVVGNVDPDQIKILADKWFGEIPRRDIEQKEIPKEPHQEEPRKEKVERGVPHNVLYKGFRMCARNHPDFYPTDLISDLLGNGKSSRLYQQLVKKKQIFATIDAFITGDIDEGLLLISGSLSEQVNMADAEAELNKELNELKETRITEEELQKVKNKVEAVNTFSKTSALHKAMNLSFYELLGDAGRINQEIENYRKTTTHDIQRVSNYLLDETNSNTLYYHAKKS
ncbi:MAG: pitrilysin family protein [Bacteroidales bacterium]|nr:insulinase family protein [Bacteroidales bacterium]MBS3774559.1 insulinase family protein [Bacteroidales bacterium]